MAKKDPSKLFDFIHIFFNDAKTYDTLKGYEKARHQFMLNRFMSINYPIEAQTFNMMGISPDAVVDCWHMVARNYSRTPGWIFTRVRKTKKQKEKEFNPSEEALDLYFKANEIGTREYKEALKFDKEKVVSDLKLLEKQLQMNGS